MSAEEITGAISNVVSSEHRKRLHESIFGTLLGQSLVLLAMLVVLSMGAGVLYRHIEELGQLTFWLMLVALFAIVLVFSILPTAFRAWREQRLRRFVIDETPRRGGSAFRLHPYGLQDRDHYSRPDGADAKVKGWLEATDKTLLYLSGTSGSGKSSLLGASVVPYLRDSGWESITIRIDRDPVEQFRQALFDEPHLFEKSLSRNTGLKSLLERASQERARSGAPPLLIIIDQFEEVLILNNPANQAPLIELLNALHDNPLPQLRLLCVFRSDYRELLFKLGLPRYIGSDNGYELSPFLRTEAEEFLRQGAGKLKTEGYQALFAGLDRIEVARGLYRPITLNMVGMVLEKMSGRIDGDPARLIDRYLSDCLAAGRSQDFAKQVLRQMITSSGTKEPRDIAELVDATGFNRWQVENTFVDLENNGLVRPLNQARERWEISHDFLARQIGILLGRLRPNWVRRAAPIALPTAATGWVLLLFVALDYWPALQERNALRELQQIGISRETKEHGEGLVLTNPSILDDKDLGRVVELSGDLGDTITSVGLAGAHGITSLEPLTRMPLTSLDLSGTNGITSLALLQGMPLTSLKLNSNIRITSLAGLEGMPLTSLDLTNARGITSLAPLESMPLEFLDLTNARGITSLAPLEGMPLEFLDLTGADGITSLAPLEGMLLEFLDLTDVDGITSLAPLEGMPLTYLDLTDVDGITSLAPLEGMPLEFLDLTGAEGITSLAPLEGMPLELLSLRFAEGITSLEGLEGMPLTILDLSFVGRITSLAPLEGMRLTSLDLTRTDGITSLAPLEGMPLEFLDLTGADGITSLAPLEGMPLEFLDLTGADGVTSLAPLEGMPLTSLDLNGADGITSLAPLKGLRKGVISDASEEQLATMR